jgi:hypothetical protein
MNTVEAMEGKTMEFVNNDGPDSGQPVASLSELFTLNPDHKYAIHTRYDEIVYINGHTNDEGFTFCYVGVENILRTTVKNENEELEYNDEEIEKINEYLPEVDLDLAAENDGIGPYEFWGFRGFDHGHDYLIINDQTPLRLIVTIAGDIVKSEDEAKLIADEIFEQFDKKHTFTKSFPGRHEDDEQTMELDCTLVMEKVTLENPNTISMILSWSDQ